MILSFHTLGLRRELVQSLSGHGIVLTGIFLFTLLSSHITFKQEKFVSVNLRSLGPALGSGTGSGPAVQPKKPELPAVKKAAPPVTQAPVKKQAAPQPQIKKATPPATAQPKVQKLAPKAVVQPKQVKPSPPSLTDKLKNRLAEVKTLQSSGKFVDPKNYVPPASKKITNQKFVEAGEWMKTRKSAKGSQTQVAMGSSGGGGGTGKIFPYSWYIDLIQSKITMNWKEPPKPLVTEDNPSAIVSFVIHRDGRIENVSLSTKSSMQALNDSVISAVQISSPLPPLPDEYPDDKLAVKIKFELTQ
jgi:colicin import membrane protein